MPTASPRPPRRPAPTRPRSLSRSAGWAGAGWGAVTALFAHAVVVGLAFLAWVSAPGSSFSATDAARAGVRLTQLAHGARLPVGEPLAAVEDSTRWSVVGGPTLVPALAALALWWAVRRLVRGVLVDDGVPDRVVAWAVGGAVAGVVATHVLVAVVSGAAPAPGGWARWLLATAALAALAAGAGALAGAPARRLDVWFSGWPGDAGEVLQDAVVPARRAAEALVLVGLVAVLALLAAGFDRAVAVHRALDPGALGSAVLLLGQLGWLPTAVVWAVAWVAGPGLAVGARTASPGVVPEVALPAVPVLGAVPAAGELPGWWWLVLAAPVAVGALLPGAVRARVAQFVEDSSWQDVAWRCLAASVLVGLLFGLLGILATVGVAPGPLSAVGPRALVAPTLAAELALGAGVRLGVEWLLGRRRRVSDPA